MRENKDEDYRIRQMTHRLEAIKNGTEIPYVYKTDFEQKTDAVFAFFTNRPLRIVMYIIIILVMIMVKSFINVKGTEALLEKNNKLISIYGVSAKPYDLYEQLDKDGQRLKIYGTTFGESKSRLQELLEEDKKKEIIPTLIIFGNVILIVVELIVAISKKQNE